MGNAFLSHEAVPSFKNFAYHEAKPSWLCNRELGNPRIVRSITPHYTTNDENTEPILLRVASKRRQIFMEELFYFL